MRGLDTRVLLAQARITTLTDPSKGAEQAEAAMGSAVLDGVTDVGNGIMTPPLQFAGEPKLLSYWAMGVDLGILNKAAEVDLAKRLKEDSQPLGGFANMPAPFDAAASLRHNG